MDDITKKILSSTSYYTPLEYISGRITEYDIKAANINILKEANAITDDEYYMLSNAPKEYREIYIGNMIRNKAGSYDIIKNGIINAKLKLGESNDIKQEEIVRIANDAVYINRPYNLRSTKFGLVNFKNKGTYNVVLQLFADSVYNNKVYRRNACTVYFWYDSNGNMNLITKGLGSKESYHQNYMLSFIATVINNLERSTVDDALNLISQFYVDYTERKLDMGYYRELNAESGYKVSFGKDTYIVDIARIEDIDINFNLSIIRNLWATIIRKKTQ